MKNKCKPVLNKKTLKWECSECHVWMKSVTEVRKCNDVMNLFGGIFKNKVK